MDMRHSSLLAGNFTCGGDAVRYRPWVPSPKTKGGTCPVFSLRRGQMDGHVPTQASGGSVPTARPAPTPDRC